MLPECDPTIFREGTPLLMADTHEGGGAEVFERWIEDIRRLSQQQVDWHYSGGRAQVLVIGDLELVRNAIKKLPWRGSFRLFLAGEGLYRNLTQ